MLIRQTTYVTVDSSVWFYLKSILVCRKGKTGGRDGGTGQVIQEERKRWGKQCLLYVRLQHSLVQASMYSVPNEERFSFSNTSNNGEDRCYTLWNIAKYWKYSARDFNFQFVSLMHLTKTQNTIVPSWLLSGLRKNEHDVTPFLATWWTF